MAQNGLTEDSTGDLLCCGYSVFTPGAGQTYRTNVPVPGYRRFQRNIPNMHRWNGATYIEVPQPAITTCHTSTPTDTLRAELDSDEDSDQAAGNAHEWELWDGNPDDGGVVAFKISLVNNVVTLSTPASGGLSIGDLQVNSLGVGVVPSGGTGQIDTASVIRAAGGSAGVPSFSFTNDIDTGVYRVTADQIGFATSGVLRVRIDNGNLRLYVGQVWNSDNTNDVGASGTLRPRTQYLGTALNVGSPVVSTGVGDGVFGDGTRTMKYSAASHVLGFTGGEALVGTLDAEALSLMSNNASRWKVSSAGNFRAALDNTYDHGGSGLERARTMYLGKSLNVGDGVTVTVVNGSINAGDGTRLLQWNAATASVTISGAQSQYMRFWNATDAFHCGLVSELGTQIIDFGANTSHFGTWVQATQGGFMRVDTRAGQAIFTVRTRAAGSSSIRQAIGVDANGHVLFRPAGSLPDANITVYVYDTFTATSGAKVAFAALARIQPSGASTGESAALNSEIDFTGTVNHVRCDAGVYLARQLSSHTAGTLTHLRAVRGRVRLEGVGIITNVSAGYFGFESSGPGTYSNVYGTYIENVPYGTNRWGIYSAHTGNHTLMGYLNVGVDGAVTTVGSAAFGDGTRSWKFDAAAGTVTQTINLNGAQNSLVLENTNAGAGAQVRASFQIGADVGSGNAKGMVLFHTSANAGWANYEARSLIFYTGPTAGAATPRVEISKTGRTRVYQDLRVGSAVDTIDEGDFCAGNIYHRVWFDRSAGQWVQIWDRNGAAADVIIRNNNALSGAQARFALQRGGDAGTGTARGMVLFHTSAGAGWANYEALPLQFYTGTTAGSASVRASIAKTGGVRIGSAAPTGNSGDLRIDGVLTHAGATSGFNNATPVAKQTVTGSRGGNAALASLLTALATVGLITDSTTA